VGDNKKEVIAIRKTIPAGTTVDILERIKAPGTVEELRVRFYAGQERELHVFPVILHKGNQAENLLTYPNGSENYLSGEDDALIFPCVLSVDNDDQLKITAININATYNYTLSVDIVIDYYAGKNRVAGGVVSG
jgi:hypothetical protein